MNAAPRYVVPVLIGLSLLPSEGYADSSLEVESSMLLWKKDFVYRTQVNADISLTNTRIEVDESGRQSQGVQDRSFHYDGVLSYTTQGVKTSDYNGSAVRQYETCDMQKFESDPLLIKTEAGYWDVWKSRVGEWTGLGSLPKEWEDKFEVVERNAEVGGGSYIIVRQKPDSPNLLGGGALELAFQSMGTLSRKMFLLEWTAPESFPRSKLSVTPVEGKDIVRTGGSVDVTVKDLIGRESKLLYKAMLGFNTRREGGETWVVEGEALEALIHPTVEGRFRGRGVVKAEVVNDASPLSTIPQMNGLKLKFVRSGIVDGRSITTDLRLVFGTVDGGTHETKLIPEVKGFSGEIWLDTENQAVRYGLLKVEKSQYDGYLPKVGEISAQVKLEADLDFELEYIQSITAAEEPGAVE